ncbi:MAG: hypothetical protein IJW55_10265 [Clostridia bacterium]|nr:hypothetical protein [Clostridia bacterium]MBQ7348332.1 hypothetical protein [Clostridia bacterium]
MATLLKIFPDGKSNPSDVTTTEPYVFTNCYLKHPNCDMRVGWLLVENGDVGVGIDVLLRGDFGTAMAL